MRKQIVCCLVAIPILILIGTREAQEKILTNYDLASLYEMASEVIEATELSVSEDETNVQVDRVYKGELKPGTKIDVVHHSYRRELWPDVSSTTIQPNGESKPYKPKKLEVLGTLMFLQKTGKVNTYAPVPSGIILIRKSDVLGYKQKNNPGPYFLQVQKQEYITLTNTEAYTGKELKMDLEQAIRKGEKFHQILLRNSLAELKSYLPLHPNGAYNGNWLARKAAERIAAIANKKEIEQILLEHRDKCEFAVRQILEDKLKDNMSESKQDQVQDPIDNLVKQLSINQLWENGKYPQIRLPSTTSLEEVVSEVFQRISLAEGPVTSHSIQTIRVVHIPSSLPDQYTAVIVQTNIGKKIVLLKYQGELLGWWSRVFDPT